MHCWSYGLETPLAQHDVNRVVVYTIRSKSEQQRSQNTCQTTHGPGTSNSPPLLSLLSTNWIFLDIYLLCSNSGKVSRNDDDDDDDVHTKACASSKRLRFETHAVRLRRQPSRTNFHFGSSIGSRWISNILYLKRFMRIYLFDRLDCLDDTVSL